MIVEDSSAQRQGKGNRNGGQSTQSSQRQDRSSAGQNGVGLNAQQVAARMMANFDADGNGALDIDELTNGMTALEQSMQQRRGDGQQRQCEGQGTETDIESTTGFENRSRRSQGSAQRAGRGGQRRGR